MIKAPTDPLVWPAVTRLQPGIRAFAGHTNTMLDVVRRIGAPMRDPRFLSFQTHVRGS
jgi:hypothetical protein